MSDDNFYDFDSFLNFGNKHSVKTDNPGIEDRPKPQIDDNHSPNTQSLPHSHSINTWRQSSTVRKSKPRTTPLRSMQNQKHNRNRVSEIELPEISTDTNLKSVDWASGSPFDKFDSFLNDRNSINSDWYPWTEESFGDTTSKQKSSDQSFVRSNKLRGKSRKTVSTSTTVKTQKPKPQKKLNLNQLDKATVREICQTTRMRHVKNLCKEYSLALPKKSATVIPARKWPVKKKRTRRPKPEPRQHTSSTSSPKPVSQRKTGAKLHETNSKKKGPLFFKPNSFQRRKTQHSLLDSLTSLIWPPANLFRTPPQPLASSSSSKNPLSGRRSDMILSSRKGWLADVLNNYGFV